MRCGYAPPPQDPKPDRPPGGQDQAGGQGLSLSSPRPADFLSSGEQELCLLVTEA